jgi:hypothetical protein
MARAKNRVQSTMAPVLARSSDQDIMSLIEDMKQTVAPHAPASANTGNKNQRHSSGATKGKSTDAFLQFFDPTKLKLIGDSALWNDTLTYTGEAESMLLACSEVGREGLEDRDYGTASHDRKRASDIMLEAVRWRAMKRLSTQFRDILGERLGTGWPRHFEKWLFSRRSAASSTSRTADPIFPSSDVVMNDPELQRKLVASGLQEAYAGNLCRMVGHAATKAALGAARANLGSGRKGRVAVEELEMVEGTRRRVKLVLSCGGMSVEINEVHFHKLRALYRGEVAASGSGQDTALAKWGGPELVGAVFRVLARYSAYQGAHFKAGEGVGGGGWRER